MRIVNERYSVADNNMFLSCIVEYNGTLFKIANISPTKLYKWSGFNGWLYIDNGDTKNTTKEYIDQFLNIMKTFSNEQEH
jgi:hypothetical protein